MRSLSEMAKHPENARALLIILDGFGIGKDSPFNAIENARMPFYRELLAKYPHSQLITHGEEVGLPDGIMGNSEVGHMTMGAGRVIYQDLTRVNKAIREKSFFKNETLRSAIEAGAKKTGRVHLMGLLSDGGVHSDIQHLFALLDLCQQMKVPHVSVHVFLDGRDTPPNSGVKYVAQLLKHPAFSTSTGTQAVIASVMGRYYAMDRDKRWDRIELAYRAMTAQTDSTAENSSPLEVIEKSYQAGKGDEFVLPVLMDQNAAIQNGDSLIFFNFRADRAREITETLNSENFSEFDRGKAPKLSAFAGMTQYDRSWDLPAAFQPQRFENIFGEWLEKRELSQLRIAETEKYAHVTFFFNGGRENAFKNEDRILVASPRDVPTYDLKPEMSALEVAKRAAEDLSQKKHDFVVMNFANADMVGHTGNYEATIKAMEVLDQCLGQVVSAAERNGYHTLITADHGNAEEMVDENEHLHTQHTLNPVPALWVSPNSANAPKSERKNLNDGGLKDIMPTLCELMGLPVPEEVTGKSLLPR